MVTTLHTESIEVVVEKYRQYLEKRTMKKVQIDASGALSGWLKITIGERPPYQERLRVARAKVESHIFK